MKFGGRVPIMPASTGHSPWIALATYRGVSLSSISTVSFTTSVASLPNPLFARAMFTAAFSSRPRERLRAKSLACRHHGKGDASQLVGHCGAGPRGLAREAAAGQSRKAPLRLPTTRNSAVAPPQSLTAVAPPKTSNRRRQRLPCLVMPPNLSLPPLEFCRGVSPSQAEKSRPDLKILGSGTLAAIAEAVIVPAPGMLASNRLTGFCLSAAVSSASSPAMDFSIPANWRARTRNAALAVMGSAVSASAVSIRSATRPIPLAAMKPNSARCPRTALPDHRRAKRRRP